MPIEVYLKTEPYHENQDYKTNEIYHFNSPVRVSRDIQSIVDDTHECFDFKVFRFQIDEITILTDLNPTGCIAGDALCLGEIDYSQYYAEDPIVSVAKGFNHKKFNLETASTKEQITMLYRGVPEEVDYIAKNTSNRNIIIHLTKLYPLEYGHWFLNFKNEEIIENLLKAKNPEWLELFSKHPDSRFRVLVAKYGGEHYRNLLKNDKSPYVRAMVMKTDPNLAESYIKYINDTHCHVLTELAQIANEEQLEALIDEVESRIKKTKQSHHFIENKIKLIKELIKRTRLIKPELLSKIDEWTVWLEWYAQTLLIRYGDNATRNKFINTNDDTRKLDILNEGGYPYCKHFRNEREATIHFQNEWIENFAQTTTHNDVCVLNLYQNELRYLNNEQIKIGLMREKNEFRKKAFQIVYDDRKRAGQID
mgnify:CR=1 FL=1